MIGEGMKNMRSCTFIGHRECPYSIRTSLRRVVRELVVNKKVETFYVGTQGRFDKLVYEVLQEMEWEFPIKTVVVLAYLSKTGEDTYYDTEKSIFPDELTTVPFRYAVRRRNSYMIDRADFVIAYVNTPFSNAIVNVEEAIRKGKNIINLGEYRLDKNS